MKLGPQVKSHQHQHGLPSCPHCEFDADSHCNAMQCIGAQPTISKSVEFDIYHPENPEFDIYHPENIPPELPPTPPTLPTQRPSRRSTLPPTPPTLPTERPTRRRRTSQRPTWEKPSDDKNCWKRVCKKRRINGKTRRTCTFVREYIQHL